MRYIKDAGELRETLHQLVRADRTVRGDLSLYDIVQIDKGRSTYSGYQSSYSNRGTAQTISS